MKLAANPKTGLMEITRISTDGPNIVTTGVIMGSVPIRAVLTPVEMKKAFSLMSLKTILSAIWITLAR